MNVNLKQRFQEILEDNRILEAELMSRHTTFRIGGPADFFLVPENADEIRRIIAVCKEKNVPYFILGNGSNLLVSDKGYQGVVVQLYRNFGQIRVEDSRIHAQAGALLSGIAAAAREASLTVLTPEGGVLTLQADELHMGYRTSVIKEAGYIVLEAVISLEKGDQEEIRSRMQELAGMRTSKQPLSYPSAGSTFKRPEGYFAGKLIMDSGLRGYQVGGAQVSEKHCGFVINTGNATAKDVTTLMSDVQRIVLEKFGVKLEPEVKFLGEF